jgi:hypothetical protein
LSSEGAQPRHSPLSFSAATPFRDLLSLERHRQPRSDGGRKATAHPGAPYRRLRLLHGGARFDDGRGVDPGDGQRSISAAGMRVAAPILTAWSSPEAISRYRLARLTASRCVASAPTCGRRLGRNRRRPDVRRAAAPSGSPAKQNSMYPPPRIAILSTISGVIGRYGGAADAGPTQPKL